MTMSSDAPADGVSLPAIRRHALLPQAFRLALRDLRGGLSGFYCFLACVALGVAVIAGISALTDALRSSFEKQGQALLGGDISVSRIHTRATPAERAWFTTQTGLAPGDPRGQHALSEAATMRSMARRLDGQSQLLVELKAVDAAYPLYGAIELIRWPDVGRFNSQRPHRRRRAALAGPAEPEAGRHVSRRFGRDHGWCTHQARARPASREAPLRAARAGVARDARGDRARAARQSDPLVLSPEDSRSRGRSRLDWVP